MPAVIAPTFGLLVLSVCAVFGLAGVLYLVVQGSPGQRHRVLFGRRPGGLRRYLGGEMSVSQTLWVGGPLALFLAWWGYAMGYVPPRCWVQGAIVLWSGGEALALVNAARKSQLTTGLCFMVCLIAAGLLLAMGAVLLRVSGSRLDFWL